MKISKIVKCSLQVNLSKIFGSCTSENCNIKKKLVVWYIITIFSQKHASLAFAIYYIFKKVYLKMKSLSILKCSRLLQTNKLVISLQKHEGKNGPALYFATNY